MPTYAIGDVQGCFEKLDELLAKISFDSIRDTLWFTGDLVNRGPDSLAVLRYAKDLDNKHQFVLGNHDLHLLAVAYGVRKLNPTDTLQQILDAPDRDDLIDWLRNRPLFINDTKTGYALVHAGLASSWDASQAQSLAREVENLLRGDDPAGFLKEMYGNTPDQWRDDLTGFDRMRCIVNYFTRLRLCHPDGRLDLNYKGAMDGKPNDLMPWFDVVPRKSTNLKIIFGHWAALGGKADVPNVFPLDTGCVWGNCLTAMRLDDQKRFSVQC